MVVLIVSWNHRWFRGPENEENGVMGFEMQRGIGKVILRRSEGLKRHSRVLMRRF